MNLVSIGSDKGLSAPGHYLNQCWIIVNWTLRNKIQWNLNQNSKLFFHEHASQNIVCEMAAILPRGDELTHWGRETHICVSKQIIIGSDNGLSPGRRQAIIWTNAGILLIGPLGTNFSEILIEILTFSFKKMRLKVSYAKRRPFCFGLNELKDASWVVTCPRLCLAEVRVQGPAPWGYIIT